MEKGFEDIFEQMKDLTEEEILSRLEGGVEDETGVDEGRKEETKEDTTQDQEQGAQESSEDEKDTLVQHKPVTETHPERGEETRAVNSVNKSGQEEMSASEILESDPVYRYLSSLKPAERVKWAATYGEAGQTRLMEFMELQQQALFEQMKTSQVETAYQVLISEWAEQNRDILESEEDALITEGIDIALMRKKGYADYTQMSPSELKAHLSEVSKMARKILGKGGGERKDEVKKEPSEDRVTRDTVGRVGDLGAGTTQGSELDTLFAKASSNPMALEELVAKLPADKLESILSRLEA